MSQSAEGLEYGRCFFRAQYAPFRTILVALTCLYIIAWYLQVGGRVEVLGAIRFEFLLGSALVALSFTAKRDKAYYGDNPFRVLVALYFFCLLVQIPASADVATSWSVFIDRILKFSMMALFITSYIDSPKALRFLLFAYLLAIFKISSEGFIGWYTGSMVWQNQGIMRLNGPTGNYAHPNSFSGFAVGVLPFLYFLFPLWGKPVKAFLMLLFLFVMVIIIFTGSRTGYVGALGVLGYILYVSKQRKNLMLTIVGCLCVAAFFVPSDYFERFESIFTLQEKEGHSSEKRIEILKDATQVFFENPLGVGVAAFPAARMEAFGRSQDTHNLYLEILTNLGIHGFIVFFVLVLRLLTTLKRLRLSFQTQIERLEFAGAETRDLDESISQKVGLHLKDVRLLHAVSMTMSAFLIARLCLGMFGMDLYEIYWWLAIGITLTVYRMEKVCRDRTGDVLSELSRASRPPVGAH